MKTDRSEFYQCGELKGNEKVGVLEVPQRNAVTTVREKSHVSSAFDCFCQSTLILGANTRNPARNNLATFGDESAE